MTPDERDAQRRGRLMATALELFGTRGYTATPIEMLCAEAGIATRSFYELFDGREDLLIAVYDAVVADVTTSLLEALEREHSSATSLLRATVSAFIEPLVADERKGRVMQLEVIGVSQRVERHRQGAIRAFAGMLDEQLDAAMTAGLIPRQHKGLTSLALAGAATQILVDHLITPKRQRLPTAELIDELTRIQSATIGVPVPDTSQP